MIRRVISSDEAVPAQGQHTKPCEDCPWSRSSFPGWLGGCTAEEWLATAHSDQQIDCHTLDGAQCAGAAIYRANVCKIPRTNVLRLERDFDNVFESPLEFTWHHK